MILQSGEASTFALPLGDVGKGPDQQDMVLFQFTNVFRKNDAIVAYGWQTIDMKGVVNSNTTAFYKLPIVKIGGGAVSASTGLQRWHLPSVAETEDWVSDNALYYERPGKIPLIFQADSKSVFSRSRQLALESYLVLSATSSVPLRKFGDFAWALRHGPTYVHGFNMYGVNGARAFRYEGAVVSMIR